MKIKEILNIKTTELNKHELYALYFFLFAFLGWTLETIFCIVTLGYFTKRGFLYGPICPIYGYGALLIIIFLSKYKNNLVKLFTYSAIAFSVLEYVASYILEVMFDSYWWDYRNDLWNLNGRIAIFYTIAWGFIAIIFIKFLFPFLKKNVERLLEKIPSKLSFILLYICIFIYGIDTTISCVKNILK